MNKEELAQANYEFRNYREEISKLMSPKPSLHFEVPELVNYNDAQWQFKAICEQMKKFQDELDDDHEIALKLTSFGQSITMNVTDIDYEDPCLIYYYGYVGEKYSQLIQHVSQINFLMMAVPKADPSKAARRVTIGFRDPEER
jgi:hypothetical protein